MALVLVLLEDRRVEHLAPLVQAVESLAEADDVLVADQSQREPYPSRAGAVGQPLDAVRVENVDAGGVDDLEPAAAPTPLHRPEVEGVCRDLLARERPADDPVRVVADRRRPSDPDRSTPRLLGGRRGGG